MAYHHTAQGLASLGRHGDTMLVHMSPHEVAGLNYLAKKQGTKLTINPETGLPEAFSLGGFFSSLLPTIVGAMVPGAGLGGMAPLLAGAVTGAGLAAAKGENPLMGGLMGGFGGYTGSQLGPAISAASGSGAIAPEILNKGMQQVVSGGANIADPLVKESLNQTVASSLGVAPTEAANIVKYGPLTAEQGTTLSNIGKFGPLTGGDSGTGSFLGGMKNLVTGQPGAYEAFKTAGGTPMQLATTAGTGLLGGVEPSDFYTEMTKSDKDKYNPNSKLNLGNDTGLRLYASGGSVSYNPTVGAGISDLYNRPEGQTLENISQDGYGLGRLNSLSRQQAMNQAKSLGYASGGSVSFASGGLFKDAINDSIKNKMPNSGGLFKDAVSDYFTNAEPNGGLFRDAILEYYKSLSENTKYAKGGYLNGQGDGMSDSIPATIEGKQPARLADGEFVVPADVVSHLGNGSSRAGSQRLYSMLDKVRKARTGHTKQGRQINPNKYLPA